MTNEKGTVGKLNSSETMRDMTAEQTAIEQWLAIRKEAGLKIDPETAEVEWIYAQTPSNNPKKSQHADAVPARGPDAATG